MNAQFALLLDSLSFNGGAVLFFNREAVSFNLEIYIHENFRIDF